MPQRSSVHATATDSRATAGAAQRAAPVATQRVGVLVEIPALLRELGADPARVLSAAGLEPPVLDHIENRIPVHHMGPLFDACVEQTGCEHFSLLVGQRGHLSHLGTMGELMESAPTVGDALRSFSVVQDLNSDMGAAFVLEAGDVAALGFAIFRTDLKRPEQVYDAAMALACNMMRGLCRLHWTARELVLARPAPPDMAPYRRCFGPHVSFDQVYSAVRFSSRWLTQPAPHADPKRHEALLERIEARDAVDLVPKLHRALRVLLIQGHSSGDALAQILSLHRRTLNRRLRAQGTTFQELLDEVRLDVARQLLLHTGTSIEDIATALCYADVSAFMHAFRRWTWTTPARFRQERGGGG
jgi:AraC-like DNA-binding protein